MMVRYMSTLNLDHFFLLKILANFGRLLSPAADLICSDLWLLLLLLLGLLPG